MRLEHGEDEFLLAQPRDVVELHLLRGFHQLRGRLALELGQIEDRAIAGDAGIGLELGLIDILIRRVVGALVIAPAAIAAAALFIVATAVVVAAVVIRLTTATATVVVVFVVLGVVVLTGTGVVVFIIALARPIVRAVTGLLVLTIVNGFFRHGYTRLLGVPQRSRRSNEKEGNRTVPDDCTALSGPDRVGPYQMC